jgi:8-oxo-dGTP pyrophosphatase MutT (NUDIX family)
MTPAETETLAKVLEAFACPNTPRTISEVAAQCGVAEAFVRGALAALAPFGLFIHADGRIAPRSEIGGLAVRSMSRLIGQGLVVVDDWTKVGAEWANAADILEKGASLLWVIERRRISGGDAVAINKEDVSRVVIKALAGDGSSRFLMRLGRNTKKVQMIGGHVEMGEDPLQAVNREIAEEMPSANLQFSVDYKLSEPFTIKFSDFSIRTGAYTEYTVWHYFATSMNGPPEKSADLKWVTVDELRAGKTSDGLEILPNPRNIAPLIAALSSATPSFAMKIDI